MDKEILPFVKDTRGSVNSGRTLTAKRSSKPVAAVPCTRRDLARAYFPDACPVEAVRRLRH